MMMMMMMICSCPWVQSWYIAGLLGWLTGRLGSGNVQPSEVDYRFPFGSSPILFGWYFSAALGRLTCRGVDWGAGSLKGTCFFPMTFFLVLLLLLSSVLFWVEPYVPQRRGNKPSLQWTSTCRNEIIYQVTRLNDDTHNSWCSPEKWCLRGVQRLASNTL